MDSIVHTIGIAGLTQGAQYCNSDYYCWVIPCQRNGVSTMRKSISLAMGLMLLSVFLIAPVAASNHEKAKKDEASSELKLETLLKSQLEGFDGGEVIVSRVSLPPHTSLPKHWHPGEEFAYILEGSVTLWQDGFEDILCMAGDVVKVPLKQVHTAITQDEGATILVFRVHEVGKPERVPVE